MDHINTADTIMNIGLLLKSGGKITLAKQQLSHGYDIFRAHLGESHPHTQKARFLLHNGWEDGGGARCEEQKTLEI